MNGSAANVIDRFGKIETRTRVAAAVMIPPVSPQAIDISTVFSTNGCCMYPINATAAPALANPTSTPAIVIVCLAR